MKTYKITQRSIELGGGWSLKLFEDGEEMGGGVFPQEHAQGETDFDQAYQDALDTASTWVQTT